MLTSGNDSAPGFIFPQASEKSEFGQVFQKNMDKNSFHGGGIHKPMELILSKSQHAFFYDQTEVMNSKAYKNCLVKQTLFSIFYFIRYCIRVIAIHAFYFPK